MIVVNVSFLLSIHRYGTVNIAILDSRQHHSKYLTQSACEIRDMSYQYAEVTCSVSLAPGLVIACKEWPIFLMNVFESQKVKQERS